MTSKATVLANLMSENASLLADIATLDQESRQVRARLDRVTAERDELLALVKGAVGGVVYLSEEAGIHQAEWAAWDRWARAAIASVKGETK